MYLQNPTLVLMNHEQRATDLQRHAQNHRLIVQVEESEKMNADMVHNRSIGPKWGRILAGTTVAAGLLLAGCQAIAPSTPSSPDSAPVAPQAPAPLVIRTNEYSFEAPAEIAGGWVNLELINDGKEPHHVQLVRLNDGVTYEAFEAALQEGDQAAMPLITLAGGPGPLDIGGHQEVTVYLEPGDYYLLCFIPDPQGVPHLAHGMASRLAVTGEGNMAEPVADAEVNLLDFSFTLPTEIKAGVQTWKIVDAGEQPHEINLIKLADGKTMEDVANWMHTPEGAPPFANVGGMQGIDPNEAAYLHLDLEPGDYVAICHIPDPASGKPHDALGMVLPFTVKS